VAERRAPARRRKSARRKPTRRPGSLLGRVLTWPLRIAWRLGWRLAVVAVVLLAAAVGYLYTTLPPVAAIADGRVRGSVTMLDREGDVFAWRGDQFGGIVTASTVAPVLVDAILATEDKRFHSHVGVDPIGIASAVRINLREGRGPLSGHGGSTLTQQTAKLMCLGVPFDRERWESEAAYEADCRRGTLGRKAREAVYAVAMEARYSKEEILTIYLNRAFLGAGAKGFEAASQRYFGHSAAELELPEAAMLAGLLVAPSRYAPTADLERAQARAATVIRLMEEQGRITSEAAAAARAAPATLSQAAEARTGGAFADWLMTTGPDFLTTDTTEDVVIRTTLDQRIQAAAEGALRRIFEERVSQGSKAEAAIVVMDADGAVRAMVGGRESRAGLFNRATQAERQTGSAFKPFVYAAALDLGHSPLATVDDAPLEIAVPGSSPYRPRNFDRGFRGRVTLAEALASSLNTPVVRVQEAVGRETVHRVAADFGLENDLAHGPALALGVSEATLLEMTGAYAGILNGGRSVTPYGLLDLELGGDPLMGRTGGMGERVISEEAARSLVWMMNRAIEEGTGGRARLDGRQAAGKTGTSQSARDAWFVGFTADYVAGVWMGYDDNTPLTGVTGGGLPAELWGETMRRVHEGVPARPLPMTIPRPAAVAQQQAPLPEPAPAVGAATDRTLLDALRGLFR
jgi:membrane peptidoglycan carboxypeptidase